MLDLQTELPRLLGWADTRQADILEVGKVVDDTVRIKTRYRDTGNVHYGLVKLFRTGDQITGATLELEPEGTERAVA